MHFYDFFLLIGKWGDVQQSGLGRLEGRKDLSLGGKIRPRELDQNVKKNI